MTESRTVPSVLLLPSEKMAHSPDSPFGLPENDELYRDTINGNHRCDIEMENHVTTVIKFGQIAPLGRPL